MTTSRFSSLGLLVGLLAGLVQHGLGEAQTPARAEGSWESYFSASEGIHKLLFLAPGSVEGTLYFRCRPGEGRIHLIDMHEVPRDRQLRITMDGETYRPPARILSEETGDYLEVALPAGHAVMMGLARGHPININGVEYPVGSADDRRAVRAFQSACAGAGRDG